MENSLLGLEGPQAVPNRAKSSKIHKGSGRYAASVRTDEGGVYGGWESGLKTAKIELVDLLCASQAVMKSQVRTLFIRSGAWSGRAAMWTIRPDTGFRVLAIFLA